ncbi:conserved hypothetical protein [Ricinus communis]|uniref:Uncharacterized protein n=1 Tax=Ricinus communis TaxID=3988 RepID=B9TA21_RICCO|nr:conserved hypothetical protein [Ricinus communis]
MVGVLAGRHRQPRGHPPGRRELHGVVEQVQQHLAQAVGVQTVMAAGFAHDLDVQRQALGAGLLGDDGNGVAQHRLGARGLDLQLHPPGLDPREIQHVVDQGQQGAAGPVDQAHVTPGLGGQVVAVGQQAGKAQHAVQRRADLVAHCGQEFGLGLAGRLRAGLGLAGQALSAHQQLLEALLVGQCQGGGQACEQQCADQELQGVHALGRLGPRGRLGDDAQHAQRRGDGGDDHRGPGRALGTQPEGHQHPGRKHQER